MAEDEGTADADRRSRFGGGWFGDDDDVQESSAADGDWAEEAADRLQAISLRHELKKDPELWKPHPPTEECPLCLVPLPLRQDQVTYWACCGQSVFEACNSEAFRALAITNRERNLPPMEESCAFCRQPIEKDGSEWVKMCEERIDKKGDVKAMVHLAGLYRNGIGEHPPSHAKYLELMRKAADSGHPGAIGSLGHSFVFGELGVIEDEEEGRACLEDAAKKGCVLARKNLAFLAKDYQQHDLAIKHFKLAAGAGNEDSMKELWKYFSSDKLTKAELEETLRAHHAACDEMNSEQRKRYIAWQKALAGNDATLINIYAHYYDGFMTAKELKKALRAHGSGDFEELRAQMELIERKYGEYIYGNT